MRIHNVARWKKTYTLHDPDLLPQAEDWLFDPAALQQRNLITSKTTGRRHAFMFRFDDHDYVLRHFWRGGLVARVLDDSYLWCGLDRSRPVREWKLLTQLSHKQLPVPRPAALRVIRHGLIYQADLITVRLPRTQTLADRLTQAPLDPMVWRHIGATIARLHQHGAFHADLNARNILLEDGQLAAYLIDWDRGQLRQPAPEWQQRNLDRLRRSLDKLTTILSPFHYAPERFDDLLAGYCADT